MSAAESTFEVWLDGDERLKSTYTAATAGKAKAQYFRAIADLFDSKKAFWRAVRSRRIGAARPKPQDIQLALAQSLVAAWTGRIGTAVRYYPVADEPEHHVTRITSEPWVMGGHSAVIKVEGVSGGVCLTHVRLAEESEVAA